MRKTFQVLTICFGLVLVTIGPAGAIETIARQAIMLDYDTGAILFEKNADEIMTPSSMSKIMTIYKVFERLKDGRLTLEDNFAVSEKAWRKKGSKMFVSVNSRVKVEDLIRGIIVQSGNDASIVVAEGIGGSEGAFADELNETASELGMDNSTFINSSGWPHADHKTTARDLSKLAIATIKNFPDYYHYYSEKTFTYNGIKQGNRNPVIYRNIGADGLKTGHTEDGGYGLTASAIRNGRRLILVINGLPSKKSRSNESERLIDWGFREYGNYKLFTAGETVTDAKVWMGTESKIPLMIKDDFILTLNRKARRKMVVKVMLEEPLAAPIKTGDKLAVLRVSAPGSDAVEVPLFAASDIGQLGALSRLGAAIRFIIWGDAG
jgi:D-alanyl-D-alanine carboxypeptidase (penicillin-binding protein 5/6)